MPVDTALVGRSYPPTPAYRVSREKIREFADAIKDPNPAYRDKDAARALGHADVVAPPTMAIRLTLDAGAQVVLDPELGLDFSRVVHGEERFVHHRPIVAGDVLEVVATLDDVKQLAGNDIVTTRYEVRTVDGEAVTTAYETLVARGES